MYKLIALDLDGTLTNSCKEVTQATYQALMQAQEKGVRVILASGRPPYGIAPLANQLQLDRFGGFILSYNGALLLDAASNERIFQQPLSSSFLPQLCGYAKDYGFTIMTYQDGVILTENPNDLYVQKASFINKIPVRQVDNFQLQVKDPIYKCLIVGQPEGLHMLEMNMVQAMSNELNIFRSEPYFLEIVPKGIDKAKSLDVLVKKLNLKRENLIAVGDGWNDISMIQYAGLGIAMANAQKEVKDVADLITMRTNEEDGVVEILYKYLL